MFSYPLPVLNAKREITASVEKILPKSEPLLVLTKKICIFAAGISTKKKK
jgi:hypothetical protein